MASLRLGLCRSLYTPGTVLSAFVSSALPCHGGNRDFLPQERFEWNGPSLMATLVGLIIAMVVNLFLANSFFDHMISIAMVLVFRFDCLGQPKDSLCFMSSHEDK